MSIRSFCFIIAADTAQPSSSRIALIVIAFANEEKGYSSTESFPTTITQMTGSNIEQEKGFLKIDNFQVFPVLVVLRLDFSIKIHVLPFDFHKISLYGIIETSLNNIRT